MRVGLLVIFFCVSMIQITNAAFVSSSEPIIPFVDRNVLSFSEYQYVYKNGNGKIINGHSILRTPYLKDACGGSPAVPKGGDRLVLWPVFACLRVSGASKSNSARKVIPITGVFIEIYFD